MQTKHLHLFLLILAVAGCRSGEFSAENPYLADKKQIEIGFDEDVPPILMTQGVDVRAGGRSGPLFQLRMVAGTEDVWELQWGDAQGEPLRLPRRSARRTLTTLTLADTAAGYAQQAIPLPEGRGVGCYLTSANAASFSLTISQGPAGKSWAAPQKLTDRLWLAVAEDSTALAIAANGGWTKLQAVSASDQNAVWRLVMEEDAAPHVVVAWGSRPAAAVERAMRWVHHTPQQLARASQTTIADEAAFSLQTSDDRTNRVHALLTAALVGADARLRLDSRPQIEESAQLAPALFLASRYTPELVFPESEVGEQETRDRLRWGSAAYRAALTWGMAPDDTLKQLSLRILSGLSRLQGEYLTSDIEVVSDAAERDSLMRLTVAHVRYAGLMTLGEDITRARGDREAQAIFRREALRAGKQAQRARDLSALLHKVTRATRAEALRELEAVLDTSAAEEFTDELRRQGVSSHPDTALLLRAGAQHGFYWLSDRPAELWNPQLAVGGFTWQRWVGFRYRDDVRLTVTPDFDSLTALLLAGPVPGLLTAEPRYAGAPSLPVMAAAYENLALTYLGVRPQYFEHKLWLEPRLPPGWGRTAARVPLGPGTVAVDYDFGHEQATVGLDDMEAEMAVFFGYPLPDGGFVRTQFTLVPGESAKLIRLRREKDNRLFLDVENAP